MGRFTLELAPFDWDATKLEATPVPASALPDLRWELHYPDPKDPDSPGKGFEPRHLVRGATTISAVRRDRVQAHGGAAFLVITGRGRTGVHCTPSIPSGPRAGLCEPQGAAGLARHRADMCSFARGHD